MTKNYVLHSIFEQAYIILSQFLLQKFKMTSTDACFAFSKFWFSGLVGWGEGGEGSAKNGPK